MNRSWMNARRVSQEYRNGVEEFLQFARENGKPIKGTYYCPCVRCLNQIRQEVGKIRDHLFIFGIVKSYTIWTWHGEILDIPTVSTTENFRREGRSITRLSGLTAGRIAKERTQVEVDPRSSKASGPNAAKFRSYLGVLARRHVSIIIPSWDDVEEADKNIMWQDIQQNFDIPNTEIMRKKMLSALATSWRDFKTFLTREYVFGERQNETPCLKYQITDKEWMQFRATRLDPSWQAKRVDAQERQSKNDAPHLLSREGYELKKKKMMKARVEASEASPPRYKIAARTKSDRQMTSKSARVIVDNIEGLVEQTTHGLFVLHGRDDILTTAIGRPEHAGRVRGIDGSWSHRDYFGAPPSRSNTFDSCTQEAMQRIEMKFEEKLKNIRQEFEQKFELLARSQQQTAVFQQQIVVAHDGVRVSSKGSCAAPDPSGEQTHTDVPNQCELYVEDDPPRLVAIGRVFEGGSTIHGVPLEPDWTRVVVDQVQDVAAPVPLPNTQVQLVGQANDTFLAWPKRLVMPLSSLAKDFINRGKEVMRELVIDDADIAEAEDDPIFRLLTILPRLKRKPIQLQWDIRVFGVDSSNVPLYISLADALKIVGKNSMLNISIIQLWAMYMDKLSVEQTQAQVYEFIEPQSIQKSRNTRVQIQQYMQTWMSESGRHIYMAPYIEGSHWQLMIIIPKEYTVVWFCSLHRKPSHEMKCQLQGIVSGTNILSGRIRSKTLHFIYPKCNKQQDSFECGYYIMYWMRAIVSAGITDSWGQVFQDPSPLPEDEIIKIREQWTTFFLQSI